VSTSSANAAFKEKLVLDWTVAGEKAEVEATSPRAAHAWHAHTHAEKPIGKVFYAFILEHDPTVERTGNGEKSFDHFAARGNEKSPLVLFQRQSIQN
jgi:hypothetical protein